LITEPRRVGRPRTRFRDRGSSVTTDDRSASILAELRDQARTLITEPRGVGPDRRGGTYVMTG